MNTEEATERIAKVLFEKVQIKGEGKTFLLQDFRAYFLAKVRESLDYYPDELQAVFDNLQKAEYIQLREAGDHIQIRKGRNYSDWVMKMS